MIHKELLEKIRDHNARNEEFSNALWAVLELHKPTPGFACSYCSKFLFGTVYPCDTIQAIEKELNG